MIVGVVIKQTQYEVKTAYAKNNNKDGKESKDGKDSGDSSLQLSQFSHNGVTNPDQNGSTITTRKRLIISAQNGAILSGGGRENETGKIATATSSSNTNNFNTMPSRRPVSPQKPVQPPAFLAMTPEIILPRIRTSLPTNSKVTK